MAVKISEHVAYVQALAVAQLMEGGQLEIYAGPPPHKFGGDPIGKLLVAFPISGVQVRAGAAYVEQLEAYAIGDGKAVWYRLTGAGGTLVEGSAADFKMNGSTTFAERAHVTVERYEYRVPAAGFGQTLN